MKNSRELLLNKEELEGLEKELAVLRGTGFIKGSAVLSRHGLTVVEDMSHKKELAVFAAMIAFAKGAIETGTTEIGEGVPERIIVENKNCNIVIVGAGPKALLIVMVKSGGSLDTIQAEMQKAVKNIREILK